MAYESLDPFGLERGDLQAAMIASTTVNMWKSKGSPARIQDFVPDFGGLRAAEEKPISNADLVTRIKAITHVFGGDVR